MRVALDTPPRPTSSERARDLHFTFRPGAPGAVMRPRSEPRPHASVLAGPDGFAMDVIALGPAQGPAQDVLAQGEHIVVVAVGGALRADFGDTGADLAERDVLVAPPGAVLRLRAHDGDVSALILRHAGPPGGHRMDAPVILRTGLLAPLRRRFPISLAPLPTTCSAPTISTPWSDRWPGVRAASPSVARTNWWSPWPIRRASPGRRFMCTR